MIGAGTTARAIIGIAVAGLVSLMSLMSIGCGGGSMNPSGTAGTTGTAGVTGSGGTTGSAGSGGSTGAAGTTGSAGASGTTGAAGTGGHGGGGTGGTGGVMLGCATSVAPTAALIDDFPPVDGGVTMINEGVPGGIVVNAPMSEPAPSPTVVGGAWNVNYVGLALAETAVVSFGIYFSPPDAACIDAHTYHGVSFKISGTISGCTLQFLLADSEKTSHTEDPMRGGCTAASCDPSQKLLTLPSSPTPMQIAWGDVSGGAPAGALDATRLVSLGWQLTIPPVPDGGSGACVADITIDDVMFY
jgi:hypothetical protein